MDIFTFQAHSKINLAQGNNWSGYFVATVGQIPTSTFVQSMTLKILAQTALKLSIFSSELVRVGGVSMDPLVYYLKFHS